MADLEEMGYLTHPHTSAGRVPSEMAYRLYVNEMMGRSELSDEMKTAISNELYDNVMELEKTVQHAAKILSDITNLTSFAMTPTKERDTLKYINLLPVDETTVVLMIVSDSGKVSNTALRLNVPYTEENLELLSKTMTYNFRGKTISEALATNIIESVRSDMEAMSGLAQNVMPNFMRTLEQMLDVNLYMDGLTNIFSIPEYNSDIDRAKTFLEMLGKKDDFTKTLVNRENGVMITIGHENTDDTMKDCSVITATYHVNGELAGKIGVIGPTRMQYGEITSVIEYLTDNISNAFKLTGGKDD
jgi:heat-inducible transcriptional repressor